MSNPTKSPESRCGAKFPDSSETCILRKGHQGTLFRPALHYDGIGWWTDQQAEQRAFDVVNQVMTG